MAIKEQRMVSLAPPIFAALDALAVQTNSVAKRGPKARQHSWHVMLERIAKGEIIIQEREPYRLPAGLAEQADAVEQRQREQERTAQKQAERKAPLISAAATAGVLAAGDGKMQQLHML